MYFYYYWIIVNMLEKRFFKILPPSRLLNITFLESPNINIGIKIKNNQILKKCKITHKFLLMLLKQKIIWWFVCFYKISISLTLTSTGLAKNFVSEVTILMLKTILPDLTVHCPANLNKFFFNLPGSNGTTLSNNFYRYGLFLLPIWTQVRRYFSSSFNSV